MGNPVRQFDSLSYANQLRKVGVPEEQANLQAEVLFRIVEEQLLNKQDLEKVELKLSSDIEKLDAKLSGEIKEVKRDVAEVELRLKADIKDSELRLVFRLTGIITLIFMQRSLTDTCFFSDRTYTTI